MYARMYILIKNRTVSKRAMLPSVQHNIIHHNIMAKKKSSSSISEKQIAAWNQGDNTNLRNLFERGTRNHGLDPEALDSKTIKSVIRSYWPERKYNTFAPLYRRKAREFNLDRTLSGNRSPQAKGKHISFLYVSNIF